MRNFKEELGNAIEMFNPAAALSKDELNALEEERQDRECNLYTKNINASLTALCITIREAVKARIPESELGALVSAASDHEEALVTWAYNGYDDYGLTDCMDIYCGNVVNDGSASKGAQFAGIGKS
jgi:hypothetical protein